MANFESNLWDGPYSGGPYRGPFNFGDFRKNFPNPSKDLNSASDVGQDFLAPFASFQLSQFGPIQQQSLEFLSSLLSGDDSRLQQMIAPQLAGVKSNVAQAGRQIQDTLPVSQQGSALSHLWDNGINAMAGIRSGFENNFFNQAVQTGVNGLNSAVSPLLLGLGQILKQVPKGGK